MKKGFIAFAIYFVCVAIAALLDMLGLPIIPEDVEVSPMLTLVTHLPAWLYLWFSKADEGAALVAMVFELLTRFLLGFMTVSLVNVAWWLFVISRLGLRERREEQRCAFEIAQEDLKKHTEKWEEDANA